MILKSFELNKINLQKNKIILLYGKNEGHKSKSISTITEKNKNILNYDEKEILENSDQFLESLFNQSLFDNKKCIIIKRGTDKIVKIIEEIDKKKIDQITIIINSDTLEKRSKLRNFFEKSKENLCIPFYPDNNQTLSKITSIPIDIKPDVKAGSNIYPDNRVSLLITTLEIEFFFLRTSEEALASLSTFSAVKGYLPT